MKNRGCIFSLFSQCLMEPRSDKVDTVPADESKKPVEETVDELNPKQKEVVKSYLDSSVFNVIQLKLHPKTFLEVFKVMVPGYEITDEQIGILEELGVLEAVNMMHYFLDHPCPQNRPYGIKHPKNPNLVGYKIGEGDHAIQHYEVPGLFGLAQYGQSVSREAVINYAIEVIKEKEEKISVLAKDKNAKTPVSLEAEVKKPLPKKFRS
jgi:hypothetical protein